MVLQRVNQPYHRPLLLGNGNEMIQEAQIIEETPVRRLQFIEANTTEVTAFHLKNDCIVPVFSKDNEVTISHTNFIESIWDCTKKMFPRENILEPEIRVSHIIKGRTPDAIHKSVKELTDEDKTIYYERMMFCIEIPSIYEDIMGNRLNLTIGGVRSYNQENLYSKKGIEKFKLFIGFRNLVCCNMCVSTDGICEEVRVTNTHDLMARAMELFVAYNAKMHLEMMRAMQYHSLSESQFAQLIGKFRLYHSLPPQRKKLLPQMLMTDTQINLVAKSYYQDEDFGVLSTARDIPLWNVYNMLTGANKSSYIDNFQCHSDNRGHQQGSHGR